MMAKRTRNSRENQMIQEAHGLIISNENVYHTDDKHEHRVKQNCRKSRRNNPQTHMLPENPTSTKQSFVMQQGCGASISADTEFPTRNVYHPDDQNKHSAQKNSPTSHKNIPQTHNKKQKCVENVSSSNMDTVQTTANQIEFGHFDEISKGQAFFQRNRQGGFFPLLKTFA